MFRHNNILLRVWKPSRFGSKCLFSSPWSQITDRSNFLWKTACFGHLEMSAGLFGNTQFGHQDIGQRSPQVSSKISSCRRSAFQQLIRIWCKHYVPCLVQMSSLEVSVVCRNVTCSHNIHTSELWNQLNLQFWESGSRKCCYYLIISINSSTNRPPLYSQPAFRHPAIISVHPLTESESGH